MAQAGDIIRLVDRINLELGVFPGTGYVSGGNTALGIDTWSLNRQLVQGLVFGTSCDSLAPGSSLPEGADTPMPPVWPYVWDTSLIYGREQLGMTQRMKRGDTYKFDFAVKQNGVASDLTGASLKLTVRWSPTGNVVFSCDSATADGLTITSTLNGLASVLVASSKTSGLPNRRLSLVYDILLTAANGEKFTVMDGAWIINPNLSY